MQGFIWNVVRQLFVVIVLIEIVGFLVTLFVLQFHISESRTSKLVVEMSGELKVLNLRVVWIILERKGVSSFRLIFNFRRFTLTWSELYLEQIFFDIFLLTKYFYKNLLNRLNFSHGNKKNLIQRNLLKNATS